jgi:hypothetical protein
MKRRFRRFLLLVVALLLVNFFFFDAADTVSLLADKLSVGDAIAGRINQAHTADRFKNPSTFDSGNKPSGSPVATVDESTSLWDRLAAIDLSTLQPQVNAVASGPSSRVGIVTLYKDKAADLRDITAPNIRRYCKRHGYFFIDATKDPELLAQMAAVDAGQTLYLKFLVMRHYIDKYDWVCC